MSILLWIIGILACMAGWALRGPAVFACVVVLAAVIAVALVVWTGREERRLEKDRQEILREIGRKR